MPNKTAKPQKTNLMKFFKLLITGVLFLSLAGVTSCKKDNVDVRDQYVGTWQYKQTGSLTLFQNGQSIGTVPIDEKGTSYISKSGKSDLLIDQQVFSLNGTKLTSDPESITQTGSGVNMVGTAVYSGQLGSSILTINSSITGTWSNNNGGAGNFSGTIVQTMTK